MSPRKRLSRSRALTIDVVHYFRKVPTCAHDRLCDLSRPAKLRKAAQPRISWAVLFIKSFGIVSANHRVLRQTYLSFPWPHVYEHPHSVAMLATHRTARGEPWLFWSRFTRPETQSLLELQQRLDAYQSEPVKSIFQRQWQLSAFPTPIRRMLWWWTLNVSGVKRAKRTGTYFLTTLAGRGAEIQHPPAFLTANLTYGPLDGSRRSRVTIAYDHRLTDGRQIADCLAELEAALNGPVADELERLAPPSNACGDEQHHTAA